MAAIIGGVIAALLLAYALTLLVRERLLRARLLPVEARLIGPGRAGMVSASDQGWSDFQHQDRDRSQRDGSDPHTHLPTPATAMYTARWRYDVDGRTHDGEISLPRPLFPPEAARFGRVQVFYDRRTPSVSVPYPGAGDSAWAFFIAAGVVAMVAAVIFLIGRPDLVG
jgi:hypothetical protein